MCISRWVDYQVNFLLFIFKSKTEHLLFFFLLIIQESSVVKLSTVGVVLDFVLSAHNHSPRAAQFLPHATWQATQRSARPTPRCWWVARPQL